MKDLKIKLSILWLPLLLIAVGFILLYSLLNWILFIKLNAFPLQEDVVKFWLPFTLPWIPVLIWLRQPIKVLKFKNDNPYFGYQFMAVLAIAIPTIVTQEYLSTATGKLTQLETVSQFEKKEVTKYYSLNQYYIDKTNTGIAKAATVSGKNNQTLTLHCYVVIPIFNTVADTSNGTCNYFLGKKYSKSISNRLSDQEKEEKFKSFSEQCHREFDETNFRNFVYLEKMGNSNDLAEFNTAVKRSNFLSDNNPVIFTAHNDSFAKRNGHKLGWIFISFGIGALVWFIFLLFPKINNEQLNKFKKGISPKDADLKEALTFFIPKENFFITPIIMNLNILIFLILVFSGLGVISFKAVDLIHWGANYRPLTSNGQWWRLIASIFLHGGLIHLIANMIGLLFVGIFLEPLLGKIRYAAIYLITGIIASCVSLWWHTTGVSVGASGAIFGLYGFFLALLLLKVFPPQMSKVFLLSTLLFIGYNLLMGLFGGIDNAAHIGGLVSGFIIGLIFSPTLKKEITRTQKSKKDTL